MFISFCCLTSVWGPCWQCISASRPLSALSGFQTVSSPRWASQPRRRSDRCSFPPAAPSSEKTQFAEKTRFVTLHLHLTHCFPIDILTVFTGLSSVYQLDTLPKVRSKKWKLSRKFQGWHKLNTRVLRAETTTLLVSTKPVPQELNLTETLNP